MQDRRGPFPGLQLSEAIGQTAGFHTGTYLLILRNTTSNAYCFLARVTYTPAVAVAFKNDQVALVRPGGYQPLILAGMIVNETSAQYGVAYWRPDEARAEADQCTATEPQGVREWQASSEERFFRGSER